MNFYPSLLLSLFTCGVNAGPECRGEGDGFDVLQISLQFQGVLFFSGDWHVVLCKVTTEQQIFRSFPFIFTQRHQGQLSPL